MESDECSFTVKASQIEENLYRCPAMSSCLSSLLEEPRPEPNLKIPAAICWTDNVTAPVGPNNSPDQMVEQTQRQVRRSHQTTRTRSGRCSDDITLRKKKQNTHS
ncbi:hypothetical protein GOODEAATRI_021073 [Goodea atripinnis]|uniref:Uncharacterized protein n=1 Tax=Goodea atripinnis TaxID=208336 RepID=A0ABV0MTU0_9TELE